MTARVAWLEWNSPAPPEVALEAIGDVGLRPSLNIGFVLAGAVGSIGAADEPGFGCHHRGAA